MKGITYLVCTAMFWLASNECFARGFAHSLGHSVTRGFGYGVGFQLARGLGFWGCLIVVLIIWLCGGFRK